MGHVPSPANLSSTTLGCPVEMLSCTLVLYPPQTTLKRMKIKELTNASAIRLYLSTMVCQLALHQTKEKTQGCFYAEFIWSVSGTGVVNSTDNARGKPVYSGAALRFVCGFI